MRRRPIIRKTIKAALIARTAAHIARRAESHMARHAAAKHAPGKH